MIISVSNRQENIVGKGENAGYKNESYHNDHRQCLEMN